MASVEPGKQYTGVICANCGEPAPFFEVEKGTKLGKTSGYFEIECAHCGHRGRYPASELRMMETHLKQ